MSSLRRKVSYGYYAVVALLLGLSVFVVVELRLLERRIVAGEALAEFFDATLEIRRFEKNYFLYAQWGDLNESMRYAGRARELLERNGPAFGAFVPGHLLATLRDRLPRYEELMRRYAAAPTAPERKDLEAEIRRAGKEIVTLAEEISGSERRSLQVLLARYRHGLVGAIVLLAGLAVAIGQALAREVVRPLRSLEQALDSVAEGRYEPVAIGSRDREIVSLTNALNRMLRERELHERHLIQSEKLASLGTLLSGVAHELNNPLSNISTSAQILAEEMGPAGAGLAGELVGQIGEQTDRARNIVRSLLEFSRDREFRKEPLPLRPLVEETVRFLKGQIPPGVSVEVAVPADITLPGDRQRLQQVFLNLVKNAAEAVAPESGRVVVSARRVAAGSAPQADAALVVHGARAAGGRRRRDRGARQRPGDPAGDQEEDLRPLLHHQGRRQGLGARAVRRLRDHRRARRQHRRGGAPRRRDPLHDPAARVREERRCMNDPIRLLIVDDERVALRNLEHVMRKEGYEVTATQSGANALRLLEEQDFDIVLTDLKMEKVDGMQVLERSRALHPDAEVIMITGFVTLESAVEAMKRGAFSYVAKPFKLDEVRQVVREAAEKVRLKRENRGLREQIESFQGKVRIVTQDAAMSRLIETAVQVAPTDCTMIIAGESGTGKELFARLIHVNSRRAAGPFFAVNCGAFTEELLSNELFGHEKGAFTGAHAAKVGIIETAHGGTLFLDEITEMPLTAQVKLLRVIQERELLRVGGTVAVPVDVRFLAATNRDLAEEVRAGRFRQDLYFRLNVVALRIPPLAERREDIPLLAYAFLKKYSLLMRKQVREIAPEVMAVLAAYDFPGNVRELENVIERGVALSLRRADRAGAPAGGPQGADGAHLPPQGGPGADARGAGGELRQVGAQGGRRQPHARRAAPGHRPGLALAQAQEVRAGGGVAGPGQPRVGCGAAPALGPPPWTLPSSARPTTKKTAIDRIAGRWLPNAADTWPKTIGPTTAEVFPTSE